MTENERVLAEMRAVSTQVATWQEPHYDILCGGVPVASGTWPEALDELRAWMGRWQPGETTVTLTVRPYRVNEYTGRREG